MNDRAQFPSGSIMADIELEIHASTVRDQITMLHDKPFDLPLESLKLLYSEQQLIFIFEDGSEKNLGSYITDDLLPYFRKVNEIPIFQIDEETKQPTSAQIIPLTIVE